MASVRARSAEQNLLKEIDTYLMFISEECKESADMMDRMSPIFLNHFSLHFRCCTHEGIERIQGSKRGDESKAEGA